MKTLLLAGGCFWGVEAYYQQIPGVIDTSVGYADGPFPQPSYEQVCAASGHVEAVAITYDSSVVSLATLVEHFFNIVDPTALHRQGPDVGQQYRSGFYNLTAEEEGYIRSVFAKKQAQYTKPIVVEIKHNVRYDEAEGYHQDYLKKNPNGYCHVNLNSVKNVKG
jgi:peptide methionine sulfoxide reductase msrA/msrB